MNMTIESGKQVSLIASEEMNYNFVGWYKGIISASSCFVTGNTGELISTEPYFVFTPKQDMALQAVFEHDACPSGSEHNWVETAHKATLTENGGVYMQCSKCKKEEFVTPLAAVNQFTLKTTTYAYDGKAKKPEVEVQNGFGDILGTDQYKVEYFNNTDPGTATARVTLTSKWYEGTKDLTFTITGKKKENTDKKDESKQDPSPAKTRIANSMTVKAGSIKVSCNKLVKKNLAIKAKKALKIENAKGAVTYRLAKVSKAKFRRYFFVNAKTGKITVKKGLKKEKYSLTINLTASGDETHLATTRKAKVKIIVS